MSGYTIDQNAVLMCPHGASIKFTSANQRAKAGGSAMLLISDVGTVSGCPFQKPVTPPIPSPCVTARWLVPDTRVKANSTPTVSKSTSGLCFSAEQIPQGPITISSTQMRTKSQ